MGTCDCDSNKKTSTNISNAPTGTSCRISNISYGNPFPKNPPIKRCYGNSDPNYYDTNFFTSKKDPKDPKTLAIGGQAKIRKYYSHKYKEVVIEKVIDFSSLPKDSSRTQAIMGLFNLSKEAILLLGLNHRNIVKIYDFKKNPPTIVMEFCEKGSLRSLLNSKINLPPIYKIFLIYQICDGLKYVHSQGVVHGDLKCDNILLTSKGDRFIVGKLFYPIPKLADFGLGQVCANDVRAGTPGFIAPEIYEGSGLNFKTDIFALGMVMFEILSGLRPLPSDLDLAKSFLAKKLIPCTKEVLRIAYVDRIEAFLPGIKNPIYDAFYTIMILCISENPKNRPPIKEIYDIVKILYEVLMDAINKR